MTALIAELNHEEGYHSSIEAVALERAMFTQEARVSLRALVAQREERVIGLVLYYWGFDTVSASYGYHLADIIVTKTSRNNRIGLQLMQALAKEVLREDGQWISLTVLEKNHAAKQFYKKLGMTKVAVDFLAIGPQALTKLSTLAGKK